MGELPGCSALQIVQPVLLQGQDLRLRAVWAGHEGVVLLQKQSRKAELSLFCPCSTLERRMPLRYPHSTV